MREDFEFWWEQEGQYSELCGKELCIIAWSNGEYKATHPAKTLTDEEIQEISHRYHYTYNPDYIGFARAILKKASEK